MDFADGLIRWTALLALLAATSAAGCSLARLPISRAVLRWLWTAGCSLFLVHVCCAFQFRHHWSHADAYTATARSTAEMVGIDSGAGLYLNYLFALLWLADVLRWWSIPRWQPPRWLTWCWLAFFAFMAINGTVVFGRPTARLFGLACCTALALLFLVGLWRDRLAAASYNRATHSEKLTEQAP